MAHDKNRDAELPDENKGFDTDDEYDEYRDQEDESDITGIRGGRMKQEEGDLPETDEDMI